MKINANTWHFKLFNMFGMYSVEYYNKYGDVTDCQYIRKIITNAFVLIVTIPFILLLAIMALIFITEPLLVFGNYIIGNGFGPVLGNYARNPEAVFGAFYGGLFLWSIVGAIVIGRYINRWKDEMSFEDAPKTSFYSVMAERYKGWKGKFCHPVEFVEK